MRQIYPPTVNEVYMHDIPLHQSISLLALVRSFVCNTNRLSVKQSINKTGDELKFF